MVGCEPVEVQGKTGLLKGWLVGCFARWGLGIRELVGVMWGLWVGGGGGVGGVDVLWHVLMVVSLCTCVYSAGFSVFA